MVCVLEPKLPGDLLLAGLVVVEVEPVQGGEGLLRVPVLGVGHPAAGLHLVTVQAPVLQLLLEQGPAHVGRVVELPGPVVVEDLAEDSRVSVRWEFSTEREEEEPFLSFLFSKFNVILRSGTVALSCCKAIFTVLSSPRIE